MKQITKILIVGLVLAISYIVLSFYKNKYAVKLPIPTKPPFFSVRYSFNFPLVSSIFVATYSKTPGKLIESDIKGMKEMGFDGVMMSFNFKRDNTLTEKTAEMAAQEGIYPIGIFLGHQQKPMNRAFTEDELKDWENFVRDEVRKNKNTIYFWEIWNEPSMTELFRYGTPQEYTELVRRTSKIIREENPNAKIIITLDENNKGSAEFTNEALSLGIGDYFDYLSFHPYASHPYIQEDKFLEQIVSQKALLKKNGNRWKLWISEIGQPDSEVGLIKQAELGKLVFETAKKENIPVVWLGYTDQRLPKDVKIGDGSGWGIIDYDGLKKPIYDIIRNIISVKD